MRPETLEAEKNEENVLKGSLKAWNQPVESTQTVNQEDDTSGLAGVLTKYIHTRNTNIP